MQPEGVFREDDLFKGGTADSAELFITERVFQFLCNFRPGKAGQEPGSHDQRFPAGEVFIDQGGGLHFKSLRKMKHAKEAFPELLFSFEQGYKPGIRIRGSLDFRAVKTGGGAGTCRAARGRVSGLV